MHYHYCGGGGGGGYRGGASYVLLLSWFGGPQLPPGRVGFWFVHGQPCISAERARNRYVTVIKGYI